MIGDVCINQSGDVFRINEIVTSGGLYITWEEIFDNQDNATDFLLEKGYKPLDVDN